MERYPGMSAAACSTLALDIAMQGGIGKVPRQASRISLSP